MKTRKNMLRNERWSDLRAEIANIIKEKAIKREDFRPLLIHENWKDIEEKIYQTFCPLSNPTEKPRWLWTDLKDEKYVIYDLKKRPET